jgi:hypothetical protein
MEEPLSKALASHRIDTVRGLAAYGANCLSEVVNFVRGKARWNQSPANLISFPVKSTMISPRFTVSNTSNVRSKSPLLATIIC